MMRYERSSIRSVLGLRFRDATTERPVTEGLRVRVRRKQGGGAPTHAERTLSGAYVAQGVSGLRAYERVPRDIPQEIPDGDVNGGNEEGRVAKTDYLVDIRDRRGRFVPALLGVELPYSPKKTHGWLYPVVEPPPEEEIGENGAPEPTVYLFSAVQRPVPAGQGVVYADLSVEVGGAWQPAAHALMEVRHSLASTSSEDGSNGNQNTEEVWYGVADADGRVAVQFPLPAVRFVELSENEETSGSREPARPRGLSSLSGRTVPIEVRVFYDDTLRPASGSPRPRLGEIVSQRTREPRPIYETTGGPTTPLTATFSFGKSLVLATDGLSVLRIEAPGNGA
ncbi:MAG: hypothetical protein V5A22_00110 [Salinivenus sp.]